MTLHQFIDRIRGREPKYPKQKMTPAARAIMEERQRGTEGLTPEVLDERARLALEGHEDEMKEALRQSDEMREWIRSHRMPIPERALSKAARRYMDKTSRAPEGWSDERFREIERQAVAGHEREIEQALNEGREMRDWIPGPPRAVRRYIWWTAAAKHGIEALLPSEREQLDYIVAVLSVSTQDAQDWRIRTSILFGEEMFTFFNNDFPYVIYYTLDDEEMTIKLVLRAFVS